MTKAMFLPDKSINRTWVLSALPITVYFLCFFYLGINAPQFDDFQTVVRAVVAFNSGADYVNSLFSPYGEHRIVYVRLIAILVQRLTGSLDFTWMGLIGNLSLVGVIGLLACWFRRWKVDQYFLPVPFILFQLHYHHNTFTAMMALQNLTILFWALLTFWWLADGRGWRSWAAMLPAVLAVYTSGNGLFVVLIGLLMLALQRKWYHLITWIAVGGIALGYYFWNLHTVTHSYSLSFLIKHIAQLGTFIIFFCGSYFDLLPNVLMSSVTADSSPQVIILAYLRLLLPFLAGLLLISASLLLVVRWCLADWLQTKPLVISRLSALSRVFVYRHEPTVFLAASILFVLLTAGVVAVGRLETGLAQSFAIRYKIYAPLLLLLGYAAVIVNTRQTNLRVNFYRVLLPITVLISINSYVQHLNQIQNNRRAGLSGLYNMRANGTWAVYGSYYGNIDSVMKAAIDRKLYRVSQVMVRSFSSLRSALRKPCPVMSVHFNTTPATVNMHASCRQLLMPLLTTEPSEGAYFILHNQLKTYVFSAQLDRNSLGAYESGFQCSVERTTGGLLPGVYDVAVMTNCRGQRQLYRTINQVTIN